MRSRTRVVTGHHMNSLGKSFDVRFTRNGMLFALGAKIEIAERGKEIGRRARAPICRRHGG